MRAMRRWEYEGMSAFLACMAIVTAMASAPALAAPDATATAEIAHLIDHLGKSGCRFNRNGSWYEAGEAVAHLRRKQEYLLGKGLVTTSESFIEGAATASSVSGKPYLVKCGETAPVESGGWFRAELARYRAARGK